jgi:cytochrome c2
MIGRLIISILFLISSAVYSQDIKKYYLPADPLKGEAHFIDKGCGKCHSIETHGGAFGPDLARSDFNRSLLDVAAMMWNHSPQMHDMMDDLKIGYPTLTEKEIAEIAAYLYFLAYFDKPGDIAEGRKTFSSKKCGSCHRMGGIGRKIGPNLSLIKKYVSPIFLAQEMWNHGPAIKEKMDELNVGWPLFEGEEISNLMAFLRDASTDTTSERVFMQPGNPQIGEKLFQEKKCAICHLVSGTGTEVGPDLTQSAFHKSVTSIAAVMWNHGPTIWKKMEETDLSIPKFKGNEMADLTAYLYFLRFFEKSPDISRGELLFNQKGCPNCHHFGPASIEGSHSLSTSNPDRSTIGIAADMWNHAEEMSATMTGKKIDWQPFRNGELNDLIEYIIAQKKK